MANASVPGLQRVQASSLNDSQPAKDRFAGCPAGKQLLGGGGRIFPGNGQVTLDGITPNLNGITARGFEDEDGTNLRWQVDSFAICANPIPGLVQVDKTSVKDLFSKGVTAQCPLGKELIGSGAEMNGGQGIVVLDDIIPNTSLDQTEAFAMTGRATKDPFSVTAHAICADPLPGLELKTATVGPNSFNQGVFISCSKGKQLLGLGGELTGAFGLATMDDMTPNATLTGVQISAKEVTPTVREWSLKGYAICA
jgi:hypothetical protein